MRPPRKRPSQNEDEHAGAEGSTASTETSAVTLETFDSYDALNRRNASIVGWEICTPADIVEAATQKGK